MKKKLIFTLVILLFFGFVLIDCSAQSSSNALIGKWIWEDEDFSVEFFKDGTVTFSENDSTWKTTYTWIIPKNGLITLKWVGDEKETDLEGTWDFKISSSKLTINWLGDEEAITLRRK
jgi:hypothetical protein